MLWNYHDDDVPAESVPVQVTIASIPPGVKKVLMEHYQRIDSTHSNSYTTWKAMGSPQAPTPERYARLKEAGHLELLQSPEWLDVKDGKVTIATELPRRGYIADAFEMVTMWRTVLSEAERDNSA